MKNRFARVTLAALLTISLVAPTAFLAIPQEAHAFAAIGAGFGGGDPVSVVSDFSITSLTDLAKNTITSIASVTSAAANVALQIDKYVLEPLAFVLSGNLLKAITAGVIEFVAGETNGTGVPQFVQSLQTNLQNIGDIQATSFLSQFGQNSNSPFAGAITSSLRADYLQQTSLAGFFASSQCTLFQSSPNINSFLAGNWSQGGIGAWFSLTALDQNNPLVLHQQAQAELATLVAGATAARLSDYIAGSGFVSWCSGDSFGDAVGTAVTGSGTAPGAGAVAGDACTNNDGSPGTVETPGSTIKAFLDKTLGSTIDVLTHMGDSAAEINTILGNVATVMNTVNFATQLLGSVGGGGLLGSVGGSTGPGTVSSLRSSDYFGLTNSSVYQDTVSSVGNQDSSSLVSQYEAAWNTIAAAANTASTRLQQLAISCSLQTTAAQTALANEVIPVLTQAAVASSTIANAKALMQKIQNEANSTTDAGTYADDVQKLQTMPPTATDVATAQQDAQSFGGAKANPEGSLNVSAAASLVDQMNLISQNALAIQNSQSQGLSSPGNGGQSLQCNPPTPTTTDTTGGGAGGGGNNR